MNIFELMIEYKLATIWFLLFFIRGFINLHIFQGIENEEVESLRSFWAPNYGAYTLIYFTFWWSKSDRNDYPEIKKLMLFSNTLNMFFIIYTIVALLYNYH